MFLLFRIKENGEQKEKADNSHTVVPDGGGRGGKWLWFKCRLYENKWGRLTGCIRDRRVKVKLTR